MRAAGALKTERWYCLGLASMALTGLVVAGLVRPSSAVTATPRTAGCTDRSGDVVSTIATTHGGASRGRGLPVVDFTAARIAVTPSALKLRLRVPSGFALLESMLSNADQRPFVVIGVSLHQGRGAGDLNFGTSLSTTSGSPPEWQHEVRRPLTGPVLAEYVGNDLVELTDTTVVITWPLRDKFRPSKRFRWSVGMTASLSRDDPLSSTIVTYDDNCPTFQPGHLKASTVEFPNASRPQQSTPRLGRGSASSRPDPDPAPQLHCEDDRIDTTTGHATAEDAARTLVAGIQTDDRDAALRAAMPACVDWLFSAVDFDPSLKDLTVTACTQVAFPGSSGGGGWWVCSLSGAGATVSLRVDEGLAAEPTYFVDAAVLGPCNQDWCTAA